MLKVEEKMYPAPGDVEKIIELTNTLPDKELDEMTPSYVLLLKYHWN